MRDKNAFCRNIPQIPAEDFMDDLWQEVRKGWFSAKFGGSFGRMILITQSNEERDLLNDEFEKKSQQDQSIVYKRLDPFPTFYESQIKLCAVNGDMVTAKINGRTVFYQMEDYNKLVEQRQRGE